MYPCKNPKCTLKYYNKSWSVLKVSLKLAYKIPINIYRNINK